MSIKLYDLTQAYQNILELIDDEDSDLAIALQAIEGEIETKALSIANLIKTLEAEADLIKAEEQRLAQRRKARENAIERIKDYLRMNMEKVHLKKVQSPTRTVYLQANPPSVEIVDPDKIPGKFLTLVPAHYEPRKKDIIEAWKAGEEIPGVEITRGKSVRIK